MNNVVAIGGAARISMNVTSVVGRRRLVGSCDSVNIGIIGSGQIGGALTHRFLEAGHQVAVSNRRGPASLAAFVNETGARAVTVEEAARGNDVVVISIPIKRVEDLPAALFSGVSDDVVVIDTCNYYPRQRDGAIDDIEAGMTESGWVQKRVQRYIVKAFNTIIADHLLNGSLPRGTAGRIALPVAADDPTAKRTVIQLIDQIGFDAIDAGTIADSWRQQPGSPVYIKDFDGA